MFIIVALLIGAASLTAAINLNPDTVSELNVPQYLGLWYQMVADRAVVDSFETDSYCSTAQYGDNGDGTLSVHNYASQDTPDGSTPYTIDGYAYQTDPDNYPGKLKVRFESGGAPFPAPYWILELGPVVDGLYDYAIVSDSASAFLFVLARDVARYNNAYKTKVTATLADLGFKGFTAPIESYQETDCVYESTTRMSVMKADRAVYSNSTGLKADSTCDSLTSEKACMCGSEASEACSWCQSAAVGKTCFKESDAKGLPSSVFQCEYQTGLKAGSTCDSLTFEKACMGGSEASEACSWCQSAAVGNTCFKESDAKGLPSSVFQCEYQ